MPTPEPDLTAAEYALGLLEGDERNAARRRLSGDPAFAAEVADWEARLTPLAEQVEPVQPSDLLWPRIARRLAARREDRFGGVGLWRGVAAAAGLVAAVCLGVLVTRPTPVAAPPSDAPAMAPLKVIALNGEGGTPIFFVTVDPARRMAMVSPGAAAGAAADPNHSHELWLVMPDAAPVSLGLVGGRDPVTMPMEIEQALGGTLAVSVEPAGGSPTGAPTGPVVASGQVA